MVDLCLLVDWSQCSGISGEILHSINFYAAGGIIVQKKDKCAESSTLSTEPRLIMTVILTTKTMI